jgi:membrane associated rhomboid family serine protease
MDLYPVMIAAAVTSALVSIYLILTLWIRHRRDGLLTRCLWSCVLLVPVIGWVFYGGLYQPPPVQSEDLRAKESSGF